MTRNIFAELQEGFDALEASRLGKKTLRTHLVELEPLAEVTPEELIGIRDSLNMSRAVFAMHLRMNTRTVENWEQGRARPNAQATTLLRLVQRFPETIQHLAALGRG